MATPDTPEGTHFEVERMRLQQKIIQGLMHNQLNITPLDLSQPNQHILDVCCCDGLWLRDLAAHSANPSTKYYGADINTLMFPPDPGPAISLHAQDFTAPFPAAWTHKFDLVHQRYALPAAMAHPLPPIIAALTKMVKPGGYIQLAELDFNRQPEAGPAFTTIFKILAVMLDTWGIGHYFIDKVPGWVSDNGIVDVRTHELVVTFGAANPDAALGAMGTKLFVMTAQALAANSTKWPPIPGVTREDIEALPETVEKELNERGASYKTMIITGRKPEG